MQPHRKWNLGVCACMAVFAWNENAIHVRYRDLEYLSVTISICYLPVSSSMLLCCWWHVAQRCWAFWYQIRLVIYTVYIYIFLSSILEFWPISGWFQFRVSDQVIPKLRVCQKDSKQHWVPTSPHWTSCSSEAGSQVILENVHSNVHRAPG